MTVASTRHLYGPVFSRRLGRSLGIDLVPFKTCTYDCVYCQLGRTTNKTLERREYVKIGEVLEELARKLDHEPPPDIIGLAGSGEPTLHARIGELIAAIKSMTRVPVAVLTNGSLLWQPEVREALMPADLVLPSLDAGDGGTFRHVNRPHAGISFESMLEGLVEFTRQFPRSVWLEVFLLAGVTGMSSEVEKIAALARRIRPERVQLNTVSRPPAEEFAAAVSGAQMEKFQEIFEGTTAEVIRESPGEESPALPDAAAADQDILNLLGRRPCTVQGVSSGLGLHAAQAAKRLQALKERGAVKSVHRNQEVYFEVVRTT